MNIGHTIERIRIAKGMTYADAAAASGLPKTTLFRVESGEYSSPKLAVLEKIAAGLGMKTSELIRRAETDEAAAGGKGRRAERGEHEGRHQ